MVIKHSSSAEIGGVGKGGIRKKEIHITEQYKHSRRFGRLFGLINSSSWNEESLWKHKWIKRNHDQKKKKNYSLKAVKQGYYAFYRRQWLRLRHEGNLIFTASKQEKLFSYSYKYLFGVCTICNAIGNRSLLLILLLQGGLRLLIPYSDDCVIDNITNIHLRSPRTCREQNPYHSTWIPQLSLKLFIFREC